MATVADVQASLAEFLKAHPFSKVEEVEKPRKCIGLCAPWGDDTIVLNLNDADPALIKGLNESFLPERFSAIYHKKSKKLSSFSRHTQTRKS